MSQPWILSSHVPAEVIERKVIEAVAGALDREPDEVLPDHALEADLGAESLDFLDIAFTLEREFKVILPRADLLQRASGLLGEDELVRDGRVTPAGLELLRARMPELDPRHLVPGLEAAAVPSLFTVRTFIRLLHRLLAAKEQMSRTCARCGGQLVDSDTVPELVCTQCGEVVPLPSGDEILFGDLRGELESRPGGGA